MRLLLYGIFIAFFVLLPMYVLNTMVMPEMVSMQQFYSHESNIADKIAQSNQ
jgi:type II secretory pathway component PulF